MAIVKIIKTNIKKNIYQNDDSTIFLNFQGIIEFKLNVIKIIKFEKQVFLHYSLNSAKNKNFLD